jgi:hypothetical protein
MLEPLVWLTGVLCLWSAVYTYRKYGDVFHPLVFLSPMFGFIYVYMPMVVIRSGELFSFVTEDQAVFVQLIVLASFVALAIGCLMGSRHDDEPIPAQPRVSIDGSALRSGAYVAGGVGMAAWGITMINVGGIAGAYSTSYGGGWSDYGYVRDAAYLLLVALLALLSPEGSRTKSLVRKGAVVAFAMPWLLQGLLGARRGPTFMIAVAVAVSWFMARNKRPPLFATVAGGSCLGLLLIFLVSNRSSIHLGTDFELQDNAQLFKGAAYNEYIFGAGTIIASNSIGEYFWGRRWIAELFVRPVPRQVWPDKYIDFGIPEQYVGIAGGTVLDRMGWAENPGAAPAIVADLWAEWSWLGIPMLGFFGWYYGRAWKRAALWGGGLAISRYVIVVMLSIFLITQTMEAIIFRFAILMTVSWFLWRRATVACGEQAYNIPREAA